MNTFDLTIKHNLHVGLTNAINQINHLNTVVLASMNFEESKLTQCSAAVVEQLKNNLEMLSLIETEGEQPGWIDVNERLPEIFKDVLVITEGKKYAITCVDRTGKLDDYFVDVEKGDKFTHWFHLPQPPVTLSEASNHSFQQAVPEEFIDQESDVQLPPMDNRGRF